MPRRMLAAAVLATVALAVGTTGTAQAARTIMKVEADVRIQGPAVPKSFLGFSQEWNRYQDDIGAGYNTTLANLYENLAVPGAGVPVLRIGGGSQDTTWFDPQDGIAKKPFGVLFSANRAAFENLSRFLRMTRGKVILGLNLVINDPKYAVAMAEAAQKYLPRRSISAFEVGNEPEFYPERSVDEAYPDGSIPMVRPKDYSAADYRRELKANVTALRRLTPRPRLLVPGYCCSPWIREKALLRQEGRRVDGFAVHRYPMNSCNLKRGDRRYPTSAVLLQDDVRGGSTAPLSQPIANATKRGLEVRITETNSAACGGAEGMSDRFSTALWGLDWMFLHALMGASGVNFHMSSPLYAPILTGFDPADQQFKAAVRPLYYAMLAFAEATTNNSRLLLSANFGAQRTGPVRTHAWATVDKVERVVRVVLIHTGGVSGDASVSVPFATGNADVKRLEAPKLSSFTKVKWGGQTFPLITTSGQITGAPTTERAKRRGSRFRVRVRKNSAVMLTIPVSRTSPGRK